MGLPRSLSGGEGPAAAKARERAARLAGAIRVPVRLVDERLTTVTASQRLHESGKRAKEQRAVDRRGGRGRHPRAGVGV